MIPDKGKLNLSARRSHLAPFAESFRPWFVLARNAIPAAGVCWYSWTVKEVVLQIWFDGVTALAAMLAFQMAVFSSREKDHLGDLPPGVPAAMRPLLLGLVCLIIMLLFSIPYWFIMLVFNSLAGGVSGILSCARGISLALLIALASNIAEEAGRGYNRMTDAQIRGEFNWYFNMHLARVCVIIASLFFVPFGLVVPLLLGLSYVEIYPMRALRILGGNRTLDVENEDRSPD